MVSRYSVIQYVPDAVADERINIGVVVFSDDLVVTRFLDNWERVKKFGSASDLVWLKDFAGRMAESAEQGLLYPGDQDDGRPRQDRLGELAKSWMNSLQFTTVRGALAPPEEVIEVIAPNFLLEPEKIKSRFRDRQAAASLVKRKVRCFLKQNYDPELATSLIKSNFSLPGSYKNHKFDVAVANGRPHLAAHSISFEVHPPETLQDALAFMISEVKGASQDLPLAVLALPPLETSKNHPDLSFSYQQMIKTYRQLGADVLSEDDFENWVGDKLKKVVLH